MPYRFVIVEDHSLNLELLTDLLEMAGHEVIGIRTAEEALRRMVKLDPDMIIMDVQLPRLDGIAAVRWLKRDPYTANVPVVAVSAHAMQSDREAALLAGCAGYLTKPIDTRTFVNTILALLEDSNAQTGLKAA